MAQSDHVLPATRNRAASFILVCFGSIPSIDDAFARLAISIAKGGNIRTTTLKAFDEGQYRKIIESVG